MTDRYIPNKQGHIKLGFKNLINHCLVKQRVLLSVCYSIMLLDQSMPKRQ